MSIDNAKDKNITTNGKNNDVPVVLQPTTRGGLRIYKIVVLGDGGVGKSGIFHSNVTLIFHDEVVPKFSLFHRCEFI